MPAHASVTLDWLARYKGASCFNVARDQYSDESSSAANYIETVSNNFYRPPAVPEWAAIIYLACQNKFTALDKLLLSIGSIGVARNLPLRRHS